MKEKGLQSHSNKKKGEMYKVLWEFTEESLPVYLCFVSGVTLFNLFDLF